MISHATKGFWKAYRELPPSVRAKAEKVFRLWLNDPQHPSLHFKKVHATRPITLCAWVMVGGLSA